jgi:hypothetical protein
VLDGTGVLLLDPGELFDVRGSDAEPEPESGSEAGRAHAELVRALADALPMEEAGEVAPGVWFTGRPGRTKAGVGGRLEVTSNWFALGDAERQAVVFRHLARGLELSEEEAGLVRQRMGRGTRPADVYVRLNVEKLRARLEDVDAEAAVAVARAAVRAGLPLADAAGEWLAGRGMNVDWEDGMGAERRDQGG